MFNNFFNILFGERLYSSSKCQVNDTEPDTKANDGVKNNANDGIISDIERLEKRYGKLSEGKVIETTLQDILTAVPRKRARSDAYDSLVKKLKRDYGVKLIITSRKKQNIKK